MALVVTWEDFVIFHYRRHVHLVLLLALFAADMAVIELSILVNGYYARYEYASIVAVLIYLICWFLRGWRFCGKLLPAFHYISLVIEFVLHLMETGYLFYLLYTVVIASRNHIYIGWSVHLLVFLFFYLMLAYKLAPVMASIFTRSHADDADIRGGTV